MNYRTSETISVTRPLVDLVEGLMALNLEIQAGDTACQARDAYANNTTENCRYARRWQTVKACAGRSSGNTRTIMQLAQSDDFVIAANAHDVKVFDRELDCPVLSVEYVERHSYGQRPEHGYNVVWIDNAAILSEEAIDSIYLTFAGRVQQFVFLG